MEPQPEQIEPDSEIRNEAEIPLERVGVRMVVEKDGMSYGGGVNMEGDINVMLDGGDEELQQARDKMKKFYNSTELVFASR